MSSAIWDSGQTHRRIGEELNHFYMKMVNRVRTQFIILMKNYGICWSIFV